MIVQERLCHSDVSMPLDRYSPVAMDMQRAASRTDDLVGVSSSLYLLGEGINMDGIGTAFREAFMASLELLGQTILIHNYFNSAEQQDFEVRGMGPSNRKGQEASFSFPEPIEIAVGSVLQLKGGRDYWRVVDTEDSVQDDLYISFDVRVEKIDAAGHPIQRTLPGATNYYLQGQHARVNIGSQDNSINISSDSAQAVFDGIRQAIISSLPLGPTQANLLTKVDEMEASAGKPTFLERYKEFMSLAADHIGVIGAFIPALSQLLGG